MFFGARWKMKRSYHETLPSDGQSMHPDNPYFNNAPKFLELSKEFPYLEEYVGKNNDGSVYYRWKEKNATKSSLLLSFDA